jgi:signal transduction histidine kinase/CheY-like chemotaxis protein
VIYRFFPAGIRREIFKAIWGPMIGLIIVACLVPSVFYYDISEARLKERVDNLAASTVPTMQDDIWQYDLESAQRLLDSYVEIGVVTGATVSDGNLINLVAGAVDQKSSAYRLETPLFGAGPSSGVQIATLFLEVSRGEIWEVILLRIAATIIISVIFIFFIGFMVLQLLDRAVLRPILKISDTLKQFPDEWETLTIDLDDGPIQRPRDELTGLVNAIHGMREQILSSQAAGKCSEKKLTYAARLARLGYATFDVTLDKFLECDPIFAQALNMTVQQVTDMNVRQLYVGSLLRDENPEKLQSIRDRFEKGETVETTLKFSLENGEIRYLRQILRPFYHPKTGNLLLEAVSQDITEQKAIEEQLLQAQKLDAIGKLTGGVAHDFNNFLAIISGNIELTLLTLESPTERAFLNVALSAVGSGAILTQQLLSFARKQPLSPTNFDAAKLVQDSSALLDTSVREAINLEIIAEADLWKVFADPEKLKTTLLNLAVNGRDAMPDGGTLTIEITNVRLGSDCETSHPDVTAGEYVCISVNDVGHGMSVDTIQHAIEPFFTTKGVGKGTGLGLPMAFGFAKQSGGHLTIHSEVNVGTSIKLYLPRADEVDAPAEVSTPRLPRPDFTGMVVLLVEDNEALRNMFRVMLISMRCIVHDAEDGPDALALAETLPHVDLILTDVVLPHGMDGNQVVKRLAPFYPDAAVIFMSGFSDNSIIHNGRLDPGVKLLQKPFGAADLVAAITSVQV